MKYSLHPEAFGRPPGTLPLSIVSKLVPLSQSFLAEFERSINVLLQHPGLGSPWHGRGRRRYLMKRFPYSLVYTISGQELRILAVAHHSRRPGYWRERK